MSFFKVPMLGTAMDIDYRRMIEGIAISDYEAVVNLRVCETRASWVPITQEEFESYRPLVPLPDPTQPPPMTQQEVQDQLLAQAEAIAALNEKVNGGVA